MEAAGLVTRGDQLFGTRDVIAARLFYERAAEAGDGQGALRMGMTFDPLFLERSGLHGVRGDPAQAMSWYGRASALGNTEAEQLQSGLQAKQEQ
jgi:TPR repeat protein